MAGGEDEEEQGGTRLVVTVPDGVEVGQALLTEAPDGRELSVEVPEGFGPGDQLEVWVSDEEGELADGGDTGDTAAGWRRPRSSSSSSSSSSLLQWRLQRSCCCVPTHQCLSVECSMAPPMAPSMSAALPSPA